MQGGRTLTAVQRPKQLKSRMRIGGATTQLEYGFDDHAFSQSDMPTQAREARLEKRRRHRAAILGSGKREWNASTVQDNNPLCQRRTRSLQAHDRAQYKYNYRAEKLPESAPVVVTDVVKQQFRSTMTRTARVAHVPTHPDLEEKKRWDSSTQLSESTRKEMHATVNLAATRNSQWHVQQLKGYKDPVTLEKEFMAKTRSRRAKGLQDVGAMAVAKPSSSSAQRRRVGSGGGAANTRHAVSYTQTVSRKFHKYHHSGSYEATKCDGGRTHAWSCCMASDRNARGCIVTTVNPDAYNFASIN